MNNETWTVKHEQQHEQHEKQNEQRQNKRKLWKIYKYTSPPAHPPARLDACTHARRDHRTSTLRSLAKPNLNMAFQPSVKVKSSTLSSMGGRRLYVKRVRNHWLTRTCRFMRDVPFGGGLCRIVEFCAVSSGFVPFRGGLSRLVGVCAVPWGVDEPFWGGLSHFVRFAPFRVRLSFFVCVFWALGVCFWPVFMCGVPFRVFCAVSRVLCRLVYFELFCILCAGLRVFKSCFVFFCAVSCILWQFVRGAAVRVQEKYENQKQKEIQIQI